MRSGLRGSLKAIFAATSMLVAATAFAAGTPAGTAIPNSATLNYAIGGVAATALTAVAQPIVVAEVINLSLIAQGVAAVNSPDAGRALAFLLTNTGNGSEAFSFTRNNRITGDEFDPVSAASAIYIESGAQPGFQASGPNADIVYVPGNNEPVLAADTTRVIYVISNIPAGWPTGALGYASLTASSVTAGEAGANPGTTLPGLGQGVGVGGVVVVVDAVVGGSRARAVAQGIYLVSGLAVTVNKTVLSVKDPLGGALVMPGSVLTYRVVLSLTGDGTAQNLVLADPLAANTTYVPASLIVEGAARTDAADADNASFAAGALSVVFGNTAAPATRTVEFKATVN